MAPKKSQGLIQFRSKGAGKDEKGEEIQDEGVFGKLKYRVYAHGSVHIFDSKRTFKKDPDILEDELNKIDFNSMMDGQQQVIEGNGDNDDLVFEKKDGELTINLRKKEFEIISKLRDLIGKGKSQKRKAS